LGEGAGQVFPDPWLEGEISGGVEGDQVGFAMAFVRGDGEVALEGDFFQPGEGFDLFENRWVDLSGVGFPCKKGGGQVMGDSFGQDKEISPQAVEGGFKSAANRISDDQSEKNRGGTDGDGECQKEVATGASSGPLGDQTKSQEEKVKFVGQGG